MGVRILQVLFVLVIYQGLLPVIFGLLLQKASGIKLRSLPCVYTMGYIVQLSIFYVVVFVAIHKRFSLTMLSKTWMILGLTLGIAAFLCVWKECFHTIKSSYWKLHTDIKKVMKFIGGMALVGLARVFTSPAIADDTVEIALNAYVSDTLYQYNPYTGVLYTEFPIESGNPLPIFYAVFARITHIHPTILIKWFFPFILMGISFVAYRQLGKLLFSDNNYKNRTWMIVIFGIYISFIFKDSLLGFQLLTTPWNGEALFVGCVLPMTINALLRWIRKMEEEKMVLRNYVCGFLFVLELGLTAKLMCQGGVMGVILLTAIGVAVGGVRRYGHND